MPQQCCEASADTEFQVGRKRFDHNFHEKIYIVFLLSKFKNPCHGIIIKTLSVAYNHLSHQVTSVPKKPLFGIENPGEIQY